MCRGVDSGHGTNDAVFILCGCGRHPDLPTERPQHEQPRLPAASDGLLELGPDDQPVLRSAAGAGPRAHAARLLPEGARRQQRPSAQHPGLRRDRVANHAE